MEQQTKICTRCGAEVLLELYYRDGHGHRAAWCPECQKLLARTWWQNNREQHRQTGKAWKKNNPEAHRNLDLKYKFCITLAEYNEVLSLQNHVCAICFRPDPRKRLAIDHDHECLEHAKNRQGCSSCIRGLLCEFCNRRVIPVFEKFSHLQNDFIRQYLQQRPIAVLRLQNQPLVQIPTNRSETSALLDTKE